MTQLISFPAGWPVPFVSLLALVLGCGFGLASGFDEIASTLSPGLLLQLDVCIESKAEYLATPAFPQVAKSTKANLENYFADCIRLDETLGISEAKPSGVPLVVECFTNGLSTDPPYSEKDIVENYKTVENFMIKLNCPNNVESELAASLGKCIDDEIEKAKKAKPESKIIENLVRFYGSCDAKYDHSNIGEAPAEHTNIQVCFFNANARIFKLNKKYSAAVILKENDNHIEKFFHKLICPSNLDKIYPSPAEIILSVAKHWGKKLTKTFKNPDDPKGAVKECVKEALGLAVLEDNTKIDVQKLVCDPNAQKVLVTCMKKLSDYTKFTEEMTKPNVLLSKVGKWVVEHLFNCDAYLKATASSSTRVKRVSPAGAMVASGTIGGGGGSRWGISWRHLPFFYEKTRKGVIWKQVVFGIGIIPGALYNFVWFVFWLVCKALTSSSCSLGMYR